MTDLKWCMEQKKGIQLVEPNENVSKTYFQDALDTIDEMLRSKTKWSTILGYYACYNALYAILIKYGVKCEIHDCTLKLMSKISSFSEDDSKKMKSLKEDRIANQYYLEKRPIDVDFVKRFVSKCRTIIEQEDLSSLREVVKHGKK